VPLRPSTSCCPSTEKTTAGSVGATAVATSADEYQSRWTPRWRNNATPRAVTKVPSTPITAIGRMAVRNRDTPIPMPPSNRMNTSATVTMRSTVATGGVCRDGTTWTATAAATRRSAGAGTRIQRVSR
jgi:hypothetical protein